MTNDRHILRLQGAENEGRLHLLHLQEVAETADEESESGEVMHLLFLALIVLVVLGVGIGGMAALFNAFGNDGGSSYSPGYVDLNHDPNDDIPSIPRANQNHKAPPPPAQTRPGLDMCDNCGEDIPNDANYCPYCTHHT